MNKLRTSNEPLGEGRNDASRVQLEARLAGKRPLLVVLSGPSGSGKTEVVSALERRRSFRRSVSATTRPPRPGERDGIDYLFLTRDAFEHRIAEDAFAEWAEYRGHFYGTLRETVQEAQDAGEDLLLTIDVQGGVQIRARYREAVLIFLLPPDMATLEARLRRRQTESPEQIVARLAAAPREIRAARFYDYLVINREGELEGAAAEIDAILRAERDRMTTLRATRLAQFSPEGT